MTSPAGVRKPAAIGVVSARSRRAVLIGGRGA
jgi:hypothetical protein